jgi:N-acetylneuraminic acid mutarotase
MKVPAFFAGTVALPDGRIVVISGQSKRKLTSAVQIYDPGKDTWIEGAPIPTPRAAAGAAVGADGKVYVVGGGDRDSRHDVLEAYDPKKNTWSRRKPMPTPREDLWAVAAKGSDAHTRIYAIGGRDRAKPGNGLHTLEAYEPTSDTWTTQAPMPTHRHGHAATLGPDGRIYVIGGTNDRLFSTSLVEVFDPVKNSWSRCAPMPYGQECAAATFTSGLHGEVLVFAGWDKRQRLLRSVVAYNPRTDTWRDLPLLPTARAGAGAVTLEGADGCSRIYVLGGTPDGSVVEEYTFRPTSVGD